MDAGPTSPLPARRRVLAEHTAGHRALTLEAELNEALGRGSPSRRQPALEVGV